MRKLLILGLAALLVAAFTLPAAALENQFGGYWRTRFFGEANFAGEDNPDAEDADIWRVDTRTRLYYTAILNENLKLVNKFEMDAAWGGGGGRFGDYGDYGADAVAIEVKETYADANIGPMRALIGTHALTIARGFIYADEFTGLTLSYKTEGMNLVFDWVKAMEGGIGKDQNDFDLDVYGLNPVFTFGEGFSLNPFLYYMYSDDGDAFAATNTIGYNLPQGVSLSDVILAAGGTTADIDTVGIYWLGANADFNVGPAALWATAIYQGGSINMDNFDDLDVKAYLLAGGASMPFGPVGLHGQAFWASGDDDLGDSDLEAFFGIGGGGVGWAYYWSEIMGYGLLDYQASAGSPAADVSNIWAANIGVSLKPIEKLTLTGDIWYAQLVEKEAGPGEEDDLGTEIDVGATYQLAEGLNLQMVAAYLFAGDATSSTGHNDEDPYELAAQLSLSF